jgi:Domain of unknown function (DUF6815)
MTDRPFKTAVLWSGDRDTRRSASPGTTRLAGMFDALTAIGIRAEPAVYSDEMADEVREQILRLDGVLVWVDPIVNGRNRSVLDALLRDVAAHGVWVSAHPDVILKGTDTHLYRDSQGLHAKLPSRLQASGPRVLKQNRGNGGQGVWKVEALGDAMARVLHARRGSVPEELPLAEFLRRCIIDFEAGGCIIDFEAGGCIIDQPFQLRLPEGMIRCYMAGDKVAGHGRQLIKALIPPPPEVPDSQQAQPGPRIMHPPDAPPFHALRVKMETGWTPQMMCVLDIEADSLPVLWDADFLYGPRTASGDDTYVLCEINVSSVIPFPEQAPKAVAQLVLLRLRALPRQRNPAS